MTILLSLTLALVCGHLALALWTGAHRNQILKIHNDYRKGVPGACNMNMMEYNIGLENEAKAWAKRCEFKHQEKGRGENLAWYTKYGKESDLIKRMAKMWYDEVKDYTYGDYSCGAACHYTQMVWSKSTKLGCYAEDCSKLKLGGNNAYFLVCFYSPAGNMMGENPYQKKCSSSNSNNSNNNNKSKKKVQTTNKNNNGGQPKTTTNNKNNNKNNGNGWQPWESTSNNNNNNGWEPFQPGSNDGWNVVKKSGTFPNGTKWVRYEAESSW